MGISWDLTIKHWDLTGFNLIMKHNDKTWWCMETGGIPEGIITISSEYPRIIRI